MLTFCAALAPLVTVTEVAPRVGARGAPMVLEGVQPSAQVRLQPPLGQVVLPGMDCTVMFAPAGTESAPALLSATDGGDRVTCV